MKKLIVSIIGLAISAVLHATIHYVAKNGNDNNTGTGVLPWITIQKAANNALPGDTIYVRDGTYYEKVRITRSGSAGNYIVFSAYPGDSVTIDSNGKVGQWDGAVHVNSANFIKIIGFIIINSDWNGIMISNYPDKSRPQNIIIQNCIVHDIQRSGLFTNYADYVTYDGNTVYNTQLAGRSGGGQQNENINIINTTHFEIKNNRIYGTANYESIDVKMACCEGSIHHNDVTPNMSCGIYIDSQGYPISNIDIYDNIVRPNRGHGIRGIALAVEVAGSLEHCKVYNNIIYGTGAAGIVPGASYSAGKINDLVVVNNTIFNCGWGTSWGGGIRVEYKAASNIILRNNIIFSNGGNGGDLMINGNTTLDHNLIGTDPGFVNSDSGDFHLLQSSSAIDSGSGTSFVPGKDYEGGSRPYGGGYDIGAFEYRAPLSTKYETQQDRVYQY